jgi:predicted CXXCH cytochrome family protein
MTQSVSDGADIFAPFAGETVDYGGYRATMTRNSWGEPHMRVDAIKSEEGGDGPLIDADVTYTVGSHRYQQYVGEVAGETGVLHRLPMAWHRGEQRWIHMNGAFVEPEGVMGSADDYLRHMTRWNDNCIFCHNTEPVPGLVDGAFNTQVGEVGIACEACHGKGEAHVDWQADPFSRMLSDGSGDPAIAHPERLDPRRESEVCGRCHGNRIAHQLDSVLAKGDQFVPGEDLSKVSRPIFKGSTLQGTEGTPFSARFWPDGTPRLSAYELQAMQLSACHERGELRCGSCHEMHGEEADMQLREGPRDAPCRSCHATADLSASDAAGGHGAHLGLEQAQPDCLDCHMPRVVYGLLEGMITHRIASPGSELEVPDPALAQPDACTRCHVDQGRDWAARAMPALREGRLETKTAAAPDELSRLERELFAGDPLVRNLAAHALARKEAVGELARRRRALVEALDDLYPSVRWFAWRGLRELDGQGGERRLVDIDYDYTAQPERRAEQLRSIHERVGRGLLEEMPGLREEFAVRSDQTGLWIGE